jgi:hypothetical protein
MLYIVLYQSKSDIGVWVERKVGHALGVERNVGGNVKR